MNESDPEFKFDVTIKTIFTRMESKNEILYLGVGYVFVDLFDEEQLDTPAFCFKLTKSEKRKSKMRELKVSIIDEQFAGLSEEISEVIFTAVETDEKCNRPNRLLDLKPDNN